MDGGLTFSRIYSFSNGESIIDCDHNEQRIMFLTSTGRLYHTRPRSLQILELDLILHNTTELVFDSTGELNAISLDAENGTIASVMIPLSTSEKVNKKHYDYIIRCHFLMCVMFSSFVYVLCEITIIRDIKKFSAHRK